MSSSAGRSVRRASVSLVAAVTLLAASASEGSAAPQAPGVASAVGFTPPRVTMIADSVGGVLFWTATQRERVAKGLDFRLEVKTCRKLVVPGCYAYGEVPPSVLDTVATLGSELGRLVVVNVGYNDFADGYAEGIEAVMHALTAAGVERVVWVTMRETQPNWAEMNGQIRAAAARWPQLVVADWAPVAEREPAWFVDVAHMNEAGAEGFATFLRSAIFAACGNACVPPVPIATIAQVVVGKGQATLRWRGNPAAKSYDVAVRKSGRAWRTLAAHLGGTTYRVHGTKGALMQARVRARDGAGVPGAWTAPRAFRL